MTAIVDIEVLVNKLGLAHVSPKKGSQRINICAIIQTTKNIEHLAQQNFILPIVVF